MYQSGSGFKNFVIEGYHEQKGEISYQSTL